MKTQFACCLSSWLLVAGSAGAATVTINGAQTFQTIEGFGVNANPRSWTNSDLEPVLDALIDQAGMTLFITFSPHGSNWEGTNDNADASVMNWNYYNSVYTAPEFQQLWGVMAYLNQRGITDGLMMKFGGAGASWMGGASLTPGYERELAEMIASALIYARNTQHLQFTTVEPMNEPDINIGTGIHLSGPSQYVTVLHDLGQRLDTNGLSDVRFSGPELADTSTNWMGTMMGDAYLMSKLAHFGLHAYVNQTADSTGVASFIQQSPYPNALYWMTEVGVWCDSCSGTAGNNTWANAQGIAGALLNNLAKGAAAGLTFEGYDSILGTTWSYWGLFAVDNINAAPRTYTARKQFYTFSQVSRYVRPGARRIGVSGSASPLTLVAFYHPGLGQLALAGVNSSGSAVTLSGTLTSLPTVSSLELYYTDSTNNLRDNGPVPVIGGSFTASVPANCVFTLVGISSAAAAPVITQVAMAPGGFVVRGSNGVPFQNYVMLSTTNAALPQSQWTRVATNAFGANGSFDRTNAVAPTDSQRYLRIEMLP